MTQYTLKLVAKKGYWSLISHTDTFYAVVVTCATPVTFRAKMGDAIVDGDVVPGERSFVSPKRHLVYDRITIR